MKLFYFLDFEHTKQYGIPVTFDMYYHLEKGPIPSFIMNLVDEASEDGIETLRDTISFQRPKGTQRMVQAVAQRDFTKSDVESLLPSELKILEQISKKFYNYTADAIIEESHKEAPWIETKISQIIPYSLAAMDATSNFTEQEIELAVKITS